MADLSGILNVNKPTGVTSFWAVKQVKRILGVKKVGHCGTLDPLAEGVLVILLGRSTKLQNILMGGNKVYRAVLKLGLETDTGDVTGKTLREFPVPRLETAAVREILDSFLGETEQVPPMFSALKYGGRRLYELAREGKEVKREPRKIIIHSIELLGIEGGRLEFRVECSRGTYVRTLGEDIGKKLGCGAAVETLCRERSGDYTLATALDGRQLQGISREDLLTHCKLEIENIKPQN